MQHSKLVTRIKGGLGNQLFCYASARRLALVNNAELVIDDVSGFAYDTKYKRTYALDVFNILSRKARPSERFVPFERIRRALSSRLSKRMPLAKQRYILQTGVQFDPSLLKLKLQPGITHYDGFGQSEWYFDDVEEIIRSDLIIDPPADEQNKRMADKIRSSEAVALHVRWFDNHDSESQNNLSIEYYKNAIERIIRIIKHPHFFVFSDDTSATKLKLEGMLNHQHTTFVDHNKSEELAYADMWLMSLCKHFVIANSTFGWWAAWLGEEKGKSCVIVPTLDIPAANNVTAWGFEGLIPERWTRL